MGEPTQISSQLVTDDLFFMPEETFVEQIASNYDKNSQKLPPHQRREYLEKVRNLAHKLYQDIDSLKKKGTTRIDLEAFASRELTKIQGVASPIFHQDDTLVKMGALDADISTLQLPSHHHHEHDEGSLSLGFDLFNGEVAHQIGEQFGEPYGLVAETLVGTLTNTDSKPMEHKVASAASHTAIVAGAELVAAGLEAEVPGYQVVLGANIVGHLAKAGEDNLEKLRKIYLPVEGERQEPCLDDFCPTTFQSTIMAQKVLQAAQLPSQAIHAVHDMMPPVSLDTDLG